MNFIFNKIAQLVRLIFVFIFGEVQWKLPAWLRAIVFPFKLIGRKESAIYQKSRLQFYLINVMIVASLSAAAYGYLWYKSLPQPAYVTFSVAAVESTELRADAKPKELSIVFDSSAAKIELVTKTITEEFSSTPKLQAGSWSWRSDRNLVFTPSSEWVVGQKYQVFFPKEIFSKAVLLKDPFFEFEAPRITGSNTDYKFYEDPIDPQLKQAVATFRYSHILNKSEFEKRVRVGLKSGTATEYSQNLSFKVVYNDLGNEATVRSESLKIPDRDSQIEIKISSGVQALSGGVGTESESQAYVNVPGVENYFKVASVDERIISNPESHLAERFVVLNFSTAVRGKDLVSGLELSLLPEKIEEVSEETSGYDYDDYGSVPSACWQSPAEVPQDALVSASSVKFEHTENPEDLSLHSIKFSAPAQRCLLVRLKAGTRSFSGYALSQDRTFLVETGEFDRAVEILAKGSIISATGSRKLSLMGRNQSTLRVKLFRIFPEAINHLVTQTFQTELFETPGFAAYTFGPENISEVFVQDMPLAEVAPGLPQYSSFDFSSYTNKNRDRASGLYVMRVQGFDSVQNSAVGPEATRLVLISDLGLLVKRDNEKKREVYVMSFRERQPVSAAEIEVVGRNGLSVFKTTSDENGRASIPNLEDLDLDKRPTAIVVRANENLSFIPWNQVDRQLNLSRFDTGGLYSNSPVQTLTAYPFSDRGIYRPGEEADFGIVFKDVNWKQFDALPVELSVTNARGTTVLSEKRIVRDPGFESLHLKIGEEYPVGIYNLSVNLLKDSRYQQAYLGSVPFKVEEFLPDRLKVNASLNVEVKQGWVKPKDLVLKSELKNLFGTAAQGNKIKASIRLFPGLPDFSDYPGYSFNDPLLTKNSFDESLGEKLSDLEGKSEFPLNLEKYEQGLFFMRLLVEGFEKEGGRSVLTNLSTVVSPLDYLVGYKADSDLSYLKLGSKHELSLVSIGQDLSLYAVSGLKLEKSRIDYISVLSKQSNGDLAYSSVKKVVPLGEQTINLVDGRATLALDTKAAGEYVYTIFDPSGLKLNSVQFFVAGDGNVSRDLERNAELQIKTARKQYANGEQIEVSIQSPYVGTGLITIEKDHVYAAQWFKADTTTSVQTITVPEGLEGNAYVNVAFVRALDSEEIYMSPLSYGVVPFSISPEKRTVAIELNAPTKIMPGETLKIKVATAETAKVVVFAADEGIHQVGRYQQPDPLAHMYRKRALEVDTIQILDLLMPEYDLLNRSSAAGGDMDALLGKFKNPFKRKGQKPVAYWSGIHEVNGEKEFTYEVPDYFSGNIKIYAVAVNAERIGIAKSETLCQGDLVLQPTAPLAVAPEDVFSVSTTVSNTTDRKQVAVVSLMPSSNIEVLATKEQSVELEPGAEALVTYNVKALNQLGVAELIFKASAGTTSSKYTIDLSIRPASSLVSEVAAGVVSANKSPLVLEVNSNFYPEYQQRTLTVSPVPLAWLNGLARFLDTYPYGCTEQLVSKAFPSIVFSQNAEFGVDSSAAREFLDKMWTGLAARQNSDGSLSMWSGQAYSEVAPIANLHAARLMLEAQENSLGVPETLRSELFNFIKELSTKDSFDDVGMFIRAYATYLLVRNGQVAANQTAALKEDYSKLKLNIWSKNLTGLILAATLKLQRQDSEADRMIKKIPTTLVIPKESLDQYSFFMSSAVYQAFYLDLVSRHFKDTAKGLDSKYFMQLAKDLSSQKYNTIASGQMLLALNEYSKLFEHSSVLSTAKLEYSEDGQNYKPMNLDATLVGKLELPLSAKSVRIQSDPDIKDAALFYQLSSSGYARDRVAQPLRQGYEITREYIDSKGLPVSEFKQGDDIFVHLAVRADAGTSASQSAIVDLLPASFELVGGTTALGNVEGAPIVSDLFTEYKEAREDRVILIAPVSEGVSHYVYKVKVSSIGKFVAPPAQVESMYDSQLVARTAATIIEIKR